MEKPVIKRKPLKINPQPSRPWERLSADFCGPLSTGDCFVIDEHSRYPGVKIVRSISANATNITKKKYNKLEFTIVYYGLLYFKTMVLWNFDLLWRTMVLWKKKLWYYGLDLYWKKQ